MNVAVAVCAWVAEDGGESLIIARTRGVQENGAVTVCWREVVRASG